MLLAEHEGRLTHWEDLLDELTSRQIAVLMAYRKLHPWPEDREDKRQAIMAAAICSAVSMSGKAVDPNDLLKLLQPARAKTKAKLVKKARGKKAARTVEPEQRVVSPEAAATIFRNQYMRS